MVTRAGLTNQDLEFVQFHPTGKESFRFCFLKEKNNSFFL